MDFFFSFCEIRFVCIDVFISDHVQDVETIHGICLLFTASGNLFGVFNQNSQGVIISAHHNGANSAHRYSAD